VEPTGAASNLRAITSITQRDAAKLCQILQGCGVNGQFITHRQVLEELGGGADLVGG